MPSSLHAKFGSPGPVFVGARVLSLSFSAAALLVGVCLSRCLAVALALQHLEATLFALIGCCFEI